MGIQSLIADPLVFIRSLLLSLPGILLALCGHEAAHGWVALKCGDPTAKLMGRITLNPVRHIDPVGFLCMLFVGIGWARPVPVNPNHFRHARRDDLKVSLAGITANLIMCLLGFLMVLLILSISLSSLPEYDLTNLQAPPEESTFLARDGDTTVLFCLDEGMRLDMRDIFQLSTGIWSFGNGSGAYYGIDDLVIVPALGSFGGYAYEMVRFFMFINLSLAVFNLIPLPPLDGYHVLNDLLLRRPLFATAAAQRAGGLILLVLVMMGNYSEKLDFISIALRFVQQHVFDGLSSAAYSLAQLLSLV